MGTYMYPDEFTFRLIITWKLALKTVMSPNKKTLLKLLLCLINLELKAKLFYLLYLN